MPGLWELVETRAEATPEAEALVDRSGRRVSYAGLRDGAARMAAGLVSLGVAPGDVVAWELPTWVETVSLAAALSLIGTVQVPIIPIYRDREVAHCCRRSGARWLLTPGLFRGYDFAAMARRVSDETGVVPIPVSPGDFPAGGSAVAPGPAGSWVFSTSGTSGAPKLLRHTDDGLAWVGQAMAGRMRIEAGDRYALVFPFPHVGGIMLLFIALLTGCTHLLEDTFDPVETSAFLAHEGVTHAGTGTPFHLAYLAAQRAQPGRRLFPHLKCCPGGAAPKPPTLHAQVRDELGGAGIISAWGLTEAPVLTCSEFDDPEDKLAASEGRALDGVSLRLADGELWVQGPQLTAGYLDDGGEAFVDGWLRTGDLGTIDAGGWVTITGRLKDVIIRNGENVSAKEVEDLLFTHPAVADVAVVGLPDPRTGERVCAVVVVAPGAEPPSLVELSGHLDAAGLRRQAIPERLELVDALPRNPAGKVTKQVLREGLA